MHDHPGRRAHNVLLEAPESRELEFDQCVDLLVPTDPESLNIWSLGITLPPDERLRIWEARQDGYPADFHIVSGQPLPQDVAIERARALGFDTTPRFARLDNPKNLTRLGIDLTESLTGWQDDGNETTVCFHSITPLLQYVPIERAYQFLHQFTNTVRRFDCQAHYHLNPRAHDSRDIERLTTLFDAVHEPREEVSEAP